MIISDSGLLFGPPCIYSVAQKLVSHYRIINRS